MSSDAAFALQIAIDDLARTLGRYDNAEAKLTVDPGHEILQSATGEPLLVRVLEDAVLVFTNVPMRGTEPEELGFVIRRELGAALDLHRDPRGVLAYSDTVEPKSKAWTALVDELDGVADWVPIVAADQIPAAMPNLPPGLEAVAAQVMSALGPDFGKIQEQLLSGDPSAMGDVSRRLQDLLAGPSGAGLMQALEKVDLDATLAQAGTLLEPDGDDDDDDEEPK